MEHDTLLCMPQYFRQRQIQREGQEASFASQLTRDRHCYTNGRLSAGVDAFASGFVLREGAVLTRTFSGTRAR
eukprot:364283-Chlamydomonas_euryale.AAC.29